MFERGVKCDAYYHFWQSGVRTSQVVTTGGQQVIKIPASQVQQLTSQPHNVQVLSNKVILPFSF